MKQVFHSIGSSVIRPSKLVFPEIKGELSLAPEIEDLINDPVYPTEEEMIIVSY